MRSGIRLHRSRTAAGVEQAFITDRFDLTAFQLGAITPLGRTLEAIWVTVVLATIVALILAGAEADRPDTISRSAWLHAIALRLLVTLRSG